MAVTRYLRAMGAESARGLERNQQDGPSEGTGWRDPGVLERIPLELVPSFQCWEVRMLEVWDRHASDKVRSRKLLRLLRRFFPLVPQLGASSPESFP